MPLLVGVGKLAFLLKIPFLKHLAASFGSILLMLNQDYVKAKASTISNIQKNPIKKKKKSHIYIYVYMKVPKSACPVNYNYPPRVIFHRILPCSIAKETTGGVMIIMIIKIVMLSVL